MGNKLHSPALKRGSIWIKLLGAMLQNPLELVNKAHDWFKNKKPLLWHFQLAKL